MSKPSTMPRQYSVPETYAELSHNNPYDPFDYTVEKEGTPATSTRLQTIDQLEKENENIKDLLIEVAHAWTGRQVCIDELKLLKDELKLLKEKLPSKGGRKSRKKRGGRKSRRRNTKKRKTNRKKRKINRKRRKTKRKR